MLVQELIEKLKDANPFAEVVFYHPEEGYLYISDVDEYSSVVELFNL